MLYSQSSAPAVSLFSSPVICKSILSAPNLEETPTSRFLFCLVSFTLQLPISNFQDDKNFDSLQSGEGFERQIGVLQCVC